jgi:hypothetical protein
LVSKRYAEDDEDERQPHSTGFIVLATVSGLSLLALIVAIAVYVSGSSSRVGSDYTSLADPADQALSGEINDFTANQRHSLPAAKAALASEMKTEASFDGQLGDVTFPGAADTVADTLIAADQKRIKLLGQQAQASSLKKLRAFNTQVQAADTAVENQAKIVRQDLGLPASAGPLF